MKACSAYKLAVSWLIPSRIAQQDKGEVRALGKYLKPRREPRCLLTIYEGPLSSTQEIEKCRKGPEELVHILIDEDLRAKVRLTSRDKAEVLVGRAQGSNTRQLPVEALTVWLPRLPSCRAIRDALPLYTVIISFL